MLGLCDMLLVQYVKLGK